MEKFLVVVPARAGSKRLPGKNTKLLNGKPLIQWTIEAALNSSYLEEVIVSTDCENISETALNSRATVPYLRSPDLSNDTASTVDVLLDILAFFQKQGKEFESIILLQPTSPLRTSKDIDDAISLYYQKDADSIISVTKCDHSPLWCNTLPENNSLDDFIPESVTNLRSQDLSDYYRLNGAIYIIRAKEFMKTKSFFLKQNTFAFIMERENSIDIDENLDFLFAEALLNSRNKE